MFLNSNIYNDEMCFANKTHCIIEYVWILLSTIRGKTYDTLIKFVSSRHLFKSCCVHTKYSRNTLHTNSRIILFNFSCETKASPLSGAVIRFIYNGSISAEAIASRDIMKRLTTQLGDVASQFQITIQPMRPAWEVGHSSTSVAKLGFKARSSFC